EVPVGTSRICDPSQPPCEELVRPNYLKHLVVLDWARTMRGFLSTYHQGAVRPGTAALPGPRCPAYVNPAHTAPSTADDEFQANLLFDSVADGLQHYDASSTAGLTTNTLVPQDHLGPSICDLGIPTAQYYDAAQLG